MATIITKNSQTSGAVPSAASLSVGELAVNTADGRLFTEHTGGVIKEIGASFPSGTIMLFAQTAAPTGWTKDTTHNDKALRVVSGTVSSGGSVAFSTAMVSNRSVDTSGLSAGATTLSTSQIPSHSHSVNGKGFSFGDSGSTYIAVTNKTDSSGSPSTNNSGGGGSHSHAMSGSATVNMAIQYVDVILATKN